MMYWRAQLAVSENRPRRVVRWCTHAWPLERTKRSRLYHLEFLAEKFMWRVQRTWAAGAMPCLLGWIGGYVDYDEPWEHLGGPSWPGIRN